MEEGCADFLEGGCKDKVVGTTLLEGISKDKVVETTFWRECLGTTFWREVVRTTFWRGGCIGDFVGGRL